MDTTLRTRGLSIGYGREPLLRGIDLALKAGELTALLGVNGIGKSTLLRTLAGLRIPLEGEVLIGDRSVHAMSAPERARHVSIVLTGRPRTGMLDVEGLVALGRHPWTGGWGRLTTADQQHVDRALQRTGAAHLRHRAISTCSDGECQKVLIARALAQDTPVLLLDEPTAFLDLPNRADIVRTLRATAHEEGRTVLFSTHDLQLALDLCDRIILMRTGRPLWEGTPAEGLSSGELSAAFAGSGIRFDAGAGTHRFTP